MGDIIDFSKYLKERGHQDEADSPRLMEPGLEFLSAGICSLSRDGLFEVDLWYLPDAGQAAGEITRLFYEAHSTERGVQVFTEEMQEAYFRTLRGTGLKYLDEEQFQGPQVSVVFRPLTSGKECDPIPASGALLAIGVEGVWHGGYLLNKGKRLESPASLPLRPSIMQTALPSYSGEVYYLVQVPENGTADFARIREAVLATVGGAEGKPTITFEPNRSQRYEIWPFREPYVAEPFRPWWVGRGDHPKWGESGRIYTAKQILEAFGG